MQRHIPELLAELDEQRMWGDLLYIAEDPLPFRKANHCLPGHDKNTLQETDVFVTNRLAACGYQVERESCLVQPFGRDVTKPIRHQYAPPVPETPSYTADNLYAQKSGNLEPEEIILLLAHKDSQSWIDSPGAYDNAAGTVALLELARVLAAYPTKRTVRFLFCNEEHTPWTSITAAQNARDRGDNLIYIANIDSLGGKSAEDIEAGKKTNVTLYTKPEGRRFADLMAEVNDRYSIGLEQTSVQRPGPGDDDGSFVKVGYGCAVANLGSYPYADQQYHLEGDVPSRVDIVNVRMAAQAILATVLHVDQTGGP